MKRTPIAVPAVPMKSRISRSPQDVAHQLRAIAAQYEMARATMLMLAAETTRLAAASSLRAMAGAVASRAQSDELIAIIAEINNTLSAAIEPVRHATDTLEQLSTGALPAPANDAENHRQALLVRECASVVHSLSEAIAQLDER